MTEQRPWPRLTDLEDQARQVLPADVWDFVAGGSGDQTALDANRAALDAVSVLPRLLTGAPQASTATTLRTGDVSMPVAIAPMAYHELVAPGGEIDTAEAAAAQDVPMVVSTLSSRTIEDIAATGVHAWFQLYWLNDESLVRDLIGRAEQAGCRAVVLTADVPVMARRPRDIRNGFSLPQHIEAAHLDRGVNDTAHRPGSGSAVATHTASMFKPSLSWHDLDRLRGWTDLPLIVKGVLDPRDAVRSVGCGADGVVVSNHGGRQLDAAPGACRMLPAVVEAVGAQCSVLFDSGVRSGTDVLRALALGADAVLLGRPVLWGLAVDGRRGVERVLTTVRAELAADLTLTGCATVRQARELATPPQ